MADGGTLLLDEIGDMPLDLQPKLLRALQEQEFERLGGGQAIRVNVRAVAATNQDPGHLVARKLFRADLCYRLNVNWPSRFRPGRRSCVCAGTALVCFNGGGRSQKMEPKQKMAIAGSSLVMVGIGLGVAGAALIVPAVLAWAAALVEKGADGLAAKVEGASKTVGTVAGTLHRSFNEAKRAGVAEIKRGRSEERNVAG